MARELFTTWAEYRAGADRLLAWAEHEILIWDQDLQNLRLDSTERLAALQRFLAGHPGACLRIVVRDAEHLSRREPRLLALLGTYHHALTIQQAPEQLASLRDAMMLVDGRHGLIRFDRDQARSKLLLDEKDELHPYLQRFEEIWSEGGTPVSPTTLGL